jgi:hypothetical protein
MIVSDEFILKLITDYQKYLDASGLGLIKSLFQHVPGMTAEEYHEQSVRSV